MTVFILFYFCSTWLSCGNYATSWGMFFIINNIHVAVVEQTQCESWHKARSSTDVLEWKCWESITKRAATSTSVPANLRFLSDSQSCPRWWRKVFTPSEPAFSSSAVLNLFTLQSRSVLNAKWESPTLFPIDLMVVEFIMWFKFFLGDLDFCLLDRNLHVGLK